VKWCQIISSCAVMSIVLDVCEATALSRVECAERVLVRLARTDLEPRRRPISSDEPGSSLRRNEIRLRSRVADSWQVLRTHREIASRYGSYVAGDLLRLTRVLPPGPVCMMPLARPLSAAIAQSADARICADGNVRSLDELIANGRFTRCADR
jgi:hypothetical protein